MISEGSCDTEDCKNGCWKFRNTFCKIYKNVLLYFRSNKCCLGKHTKLYL